MRTVGGSPKEHLEKITSRVISPENSIKEEDVPYSNAAVYATSNNNDKAAINDGIFAKFVASTHSMNSDDDIPLHTICIKASNMSFKENTGKGKRRKRRSRYCTNVIVVVTDALILI